MRDFFNLNKLQTALRVDSTGSLKPMTTHVETLAEISASFHVTPYAKAGSVLRMFQNAVGEESFREALRLYIKSNDHQAVTSRAFHNAFEETLALKNFVTFNFTRAFTTWELQQGYPLVHVSYDNSRHEFRVTQKHHAIGGSNASETSSWFIPLNFATSRSPNFDDTSITDYFEDSKSEKIISTTYITGFSEGEWFVFNKQQLNYYRVNYDVANWQALIKVLNSASFTTIHTLNRAQLLNDAIDFAENGLLDFQVALDVLKYLRYETDHVPWASAFIYLNTIDDIFKGSSSIFNEFMEKLSENIFNKFQAEGYDVPSNLLKDRFGRATAIRWACKSGNEKCLADAWLMVQSAANGNQSIPRSMQNDIYCNGLRGTNKTSEWIILWKKMRALNDDRERKSLINGLGCSDDEEILKDFVDSSVAMNSDVNYSRAERQLVFNSSIQSSVGVPVILDFLRSNELDIPRA